MKTLVINLYGGPGSGKSTTAAGIFTLLKLHRVNCELVTEFAKDLTWEARHKTLENQFYIAGKQAHRLWRLKDQVDVIVTDSPLLLGKIYGANEELCQVIWQSVELFDNLHYFIKRVKPYNQAGRNQTELEAQAICDKIIKECDNFLKFHDMIEGSYQGINIITDQILRSLKMEMIFHIQKL